MSESVDLSKYGIRVRQVVRNAAPPELYEDAHKYRDGVLTATGALAANSGEKTGRSPKDKRIVEHQEIVDDVWWSDVNIKLGEKVFLRNRQRAIDFLNTRSHLYVVDGYAGWDPEQRIKIRVICT